MKKILIIMLIIILTILIYNIFKDSKIYYVSISDNTITDYNLSYGYKDYIKDYLEELNKLEKYIDIYDEDMRITDMTRNIEDNTIYEDKNIQNILIKADLLTISLGYNDIINKIKLYNSYDMYKYVDSYLLDLDSLLKIIRKYDKEQIIMIGYYNPYEDTYDSFINYINEKVKSLCENYNIKYLDISDMKRYLKDGFIDIEGEHLIFDKLRVLIDKK